MLIDGKLPGSLHAPPLVSLTLSPVDTMKATRVIRFLANKRFHLGQLADINPGS